MQRIHFEDKKTWNYFKKIFTRTSVEGFVAATNVLYTMPIGKEDATMALKNSKIRLFGVVANDNVFLKLMQDMEEDISNLEIRVIDGCDHWMIVENPEAVRYPNIVSHGSCDVSRGGDNSIGF